MLHDKSVTNTSLDYNLILFLIQFDYKTNIKLNMYNVNKNNRRKNYHIETINLQYWDKLYTDYVCPLLLLL